MRPSKEDSKSSRKFPLTQAENFGTPLRRGSGRPEKAVPPLPPSVTKSFSVGTGLRLPDPPSVLKSNVGAHLEHIEERRDHFPQESLPPKFYPHHSSPSRQHLQALAALRFQQQQLFQQQQIFHQQLLQQSRHPSLAGGMLVEPLLPPRVKRADSNTQTARRTSITRSGSVTDQRKFVSPFPPPDFMRDFANMDSSKRPQKQASHNLFSIPSSHYSSLSTANIPLKSDTKIPELPIPSNIQQETILFPVPSSFTCSEEEAAIPQTSKPATTDAVGSSKSSSGDTSNSSTDSVIFRPSSCDDSDANDGQPDHITILRNKKNMNKNDAQKPFVDEKLPSAGQSNVPKEKILNDSKILKPLQPISTSMPYAFLRSLSTLSQGKSQGSSDPSERPLSSPSHRSTQSDSFHRTDHHNIAPSFGKLYSPVTVPSTVSYTIDNHLKKFPKQHITPSGIGNSGYLSDGEILKSGASLDIGSGYLSEGGATLYVRRIQQRFREGLLAVQESLERNQSKAEDTSLEDVSSISSSDISNAVNDISTDDNVTFSSLSACSSNKDSKAAKKIKDTNNRQIHDHHQKQEQPCTQNPSPSFYQGAASFNSLPSYYRADNWLQHFNNQGQMVYSTPLHGLERTDQMSPLSSKVTVGGDGKTRELLIPSAGIYVKKGGQACLVPADTRSRTHSKVQTFPHPVTGGTAVAIDDPLEEELLQGGDMDDVVKSLPNSDSMVNFSQHGASATRSALFKKDTIRRYFYPIRDLPSTASHRAPSLLRQGLLGGPKKQQQREGRVALDRSQSCREQKDQDVEVTNERPLSEGTYISEGGAKARQGSMPDSDSFENFSTFPFFTSSSIPRNWTIGGYGSSHFAGYVGLYDGQPLYQQLPYHLTGFNEFSPGNTLGRAESNLMSSATGGKGSSLSLLSSSSSVYSSAEDKQVQEIRKLKRELEAAQDKVNTLSTQLNTNAHVVAAFEQSLSSMTQRLQHLTSSSQQKDSDLNNLRLTIEMLKQQQQLNKLNEPIRTSSQSVDNQPAWMTSTTSVSSLSSFNSGQSNDAKSKHKKKNWLRVSFGKAFSRRKNLQQQQQQQASSSDVEVGSSKDQLLISSMSTPTSPTKLNDNQNNMTQSDCSGDVVTHLRQQLHEKDLRLTDVQLEALSSAHQLEQLYDVINRMKNEMASLRADNERLHRVIHQGGIELLRLESPSPAQTIVRSDTVQFAPIDMSRQDERKVKVYVQSGDSMNEGLVRKVAVGVVLINSSTTWDVLDSAVKKGFKEHLQRVQPNCGLGLSSDSISFYQVGSVIRSKASKPELVPLSCLIDDDSSISILLKGAREKCVDSLSFETLIPKSIVQRYVSLMLEHRRIILSGSSGTGKTFLAQKLAQHVVLGISSSDFDPTSLIATFNVDRKTSKEVHQYLSNVAEQCQVETTDLPSIIILDNLHHVGSLADVFAGFFGAKKQQRCPFLIGTMNQAVNLATANLQLHHNFKWILCVNHLEPVKGFLGRFLRRKLIEQEVENFGGTKNAELEKVVNWLPTIWQHINKFLETNISSDITLGPRLFLSCPMDLNESQAWFTDLWNFSIMPYLLEAAQSCENKGEWMDPSNYVLATYPWNKMVRPSLLQLVSDDPSLEHASSSSSLWKEDKISASSSATVLHQKENNS